MNHNDHPTDNFHGAAWQLLGDLELPAGTNADGAIEPWLTQLLVPLRLHTDFLDRIVKSAQDAAARVLQLENVLNFEHIHIIIYVPKDHTPKGYSWGFFRIEKIENTADDMDTAAHAIEFYLYMEGQEDAPLAG